MKRIYIVFTYTGTILAKIVKFYTNDKFSHVSIALDEDLNEMYSFGRLNPYNPFWGGFIHEKINCGTYKRFKNTKAEIFSMTISEKQYETIRKTINFMNKNKKYYRFNVIGLFAVCINRKIKFKHSFYCAEFVKYLLDKAKIKNDLPLIIKPEDFKSLTMEREYAGKLNDYKNAKTKKTVVLDEVS